MWLRTRLYLRQMSDWQEVGKAHGEVFGTILPAATMLTVVSLIAPEMLVEIEVDAVLDYSHDHI